MADTGTVTWMTTQARQAEESQRILAVLEASGATSEEPTFDEQDGRATITFTYTKGNQDFVRGTLNQPEFRGLHLLLV